MRVLCVLLAAALSASAGGFDGLWRYAHPDAQVLCGIEWGQVQKSELANLFKSELKGGKSEIKGLDFVKELDRALVSSPGKQEWPGVNKAADAPLLLVLTGKFDWAAMRKHSTVKRYKTVEWLVPIDGKEEMQIGVISPELLVVGDRKSLQEAIDRSLDPKYKPQGALYDSAVALSATRPLWITLKSPATLTKSSGMMAAFASDIREVSGGAQFEHGLDLDLILKTGDNQQATKLLAMMQTMLTLQAAGTKSTGPADLLKRLKVTQTGNAVRIALAVTTPEIQASLKSMKDGFANGSWIQASTGPKPVAAVHEPPKPPEKR